MVSTGFQASNLGDAIEIINQMVSFYLNWRFLYYFFNGMFITYLIPVNLCIDDLLLRNDTLLD